MAAFVSVQSDIVKTNKLMDSLHNSAVQMFADEFDAAKSRKELLVGILQAVLDPANYDIEITIGNVWSRVTENEESIIEGFIDDISKTDIKDFVLDELSDCGLETDSFGDKENTIVSRAAHEIAKSFARCIPSTAEYIFNREDFKDEVIDIRLSKAYRILTGQENDHDHLKF